MVSVINRLIFVARLLMAINMQASNTVTANCYSNSNAAFRILMKTPLLPAAVLAFAANTQVFCANTDVFAANTDVFCENTDVFAMNIDVFAANTDVFCG